MAVYIHAGFYLYDLRLCRTLLDSTLAEISVPRETVEKVLELLDLNIREIESGDYPSIHITSHSTAS